jgi:dTDP-4-dehydrorhamnose reductase
VRILLTGKNGQVGWELERALAPLGEVVATDRSTLDLADPEAIRRVVRETQPAAVVNAAAYTGVDRAESEPEIAMRINGVAPGVLAEEAKRLGALLIHYSTDYVFDGEKATPYAEGDAPNPINAYGRSKLAGERAIEAAGGAHLILRTSWVYAPRGRNFFLTIANRARAGEALRVVDDQFGVPTSAAFLAVVTAALLQRADRAELRRTYHLVPAGQTTWCGFARAIVRALDLPVEVAAIGSAAFPTPAARPKNSVLDALRIARERGVERPPWEALLADCVTAYLRD